MLAILLALAFGADPPQWDPFERPEGTTATPSNPDKDVPRDRIVSWRKRSTTRGTWTRFRCENDSELLCTTFVCMDRSGDDTHLSMTYYFPTNRREIGKTVYLGFAVRAETEVPEMGTVDHAGVRWTFPVKVVSDDGDIKDVSMEISADLVFSWLEGKELPRIQIGDAIWHVERIHASEMREMIIVHPKHFRFHQLFPPARGG